MGDTLDEVPLGGGFSLTVGLDNLAIASTINTFRLSAGVAVLERSTQAPIFASVNAVISKINPVDGSAILEDVDQEALIWLHDQGDNFVLIPDSDKATALFVTVNECVLWANASAPIPEGGVPEDALVVHEELTGGGTTTNRTELNDPVGVGNVQGTYVLNSQPYTPSTAFWFLNTAEKLAPDTALLRTYRLLDTAPAADADSDGLPDIVETGTGNFVDATDTGTNPNNPDTDGDGLLDRYETGTGIFVTSTETGTNPNMADTDGDGFLDGVETNTGIYKFYDFGDGDLAADGDNQDDLRNNTGTDPNMAEDLDEDGVFNGLDNDIDADTVLNSLDAFPFDPVEDTDTDGDGIGNNADTDDDNDGVEDVDDAFPLDPTRSTYDLRLSASAQTSSYFAQTREVRISSNTSWVWVSSDPSWLSAGGESVEQNGSQTFEYNITENIDDEPRSAELTFTTTTGDVQVTLSITQLGGPGTEGLVVSTPSVFAGPDSTVREVEILTERDWRWESNASWISSTEAVTQSGSQTFAFTVGVNDTGIDRVGTFTISTVEGDISVTVTVNQSIDKDDDRDGLSNDEETNPYLLVTGEFTWEQARLDAQRRGGYLAVITGDTEFDAVKNIVGDLAGNVWIGASDAGGLGAFEWIATPEAPTNPLTPASPPTPLDDNNWNDLTPPWAGGQPDSLFGVSGISLQPDFGWNDLNKYTKLIGYVLELPETQAFNPNSYGDTRYLDGDLWIDRDGDGLLGITERQIGTDPLTFDTDRDGLSDGEEFNPFEVVAGAFSWEAASEDANERAGRLVVIDSEEKLVRVITAIGGSLPSDLWIGGSDLEGDWTFQWGQSELISGQNQDAYIGNFDGGTGYEVGDSIVINSDGNQESDTIAIVTVTAVDVANTITEFVVSSFSATDFNVSAGASLLQAYTSGDGLGFSLTVQAGNISPAFASTFENWAENQPNSFFGATGIKMQTNFAWDDVNILNQGGYLIEREATNARNPDSDGDGLSDGLEVKTYGTNPNNNDTDADGLLDGAEIDARTDPFNPDSDGDQVSDGDEVNVYGTNPLSPDTDGDGYSDGEEVFPRLVLADESSYNGSAGNGTFIGGDGAGPNAYQVGDLITLSDGSIVEVVAVNADGDVTEFTIVSSSATTPPVSVGDTLTQSGDAVPSGATGFSLTIGTNNIFTSDALDPNDPVQGGGGTDLVGDPKLSPLYQTNIPVLTSTDEVKSPETFTPFGNSVQVVKFGDDGSQVVIDNSGILLWGRLIGEEYSYSPLLGSEQAVALDVSNSELVLWTNRYADFENYAERPVVEIALYRVNEDGEVVTTSVSVQGKEVLDTPSITTTSGSRILTTTERIEGPRELNTGNIGEEEFYDSVSIRVYRITATGEVQRLSTYADVDIPFNARDFGNTQVGPEVEVLGYGSDGSQVYQYRDFLPFILKAPNPRPDNNISFDDFIFIGNNSRERPIYYDRVLWSNGDGEVEELVLDPVNELDPDTTIERVLFMSNDRLVIEVNRELRETVFDDFGFAIDEVVVGNVLEIRDYRRFSGGTGQIGTPVIISLTNSDERVLEIGSLTIRGNIIYFYTTDGNFVRSYELTDSGARRIGEVELSVGVSDVAKINPLDGSAIIESADAGTPLIWLFPTTEKPQGDELKFIEIESSGQASALFVTNDELIVWNNAYAPIPFGSGVPNDAVIQHIVRSDLLTSEPLPPGETAYPDREDDNYDDFVSEYGDPNFLLLDRTTLVTDGIYVLNSPRAVLPNELWTFITAEKLPVPGDTALLRTYKLEQLPDLDSDGDGLPDRFETGTGIYVSSEDTGTDPNNKDSDGDGLSDGDEVLPYYLVNDPSTYSEAEDNAQRKSSAGNIYGHLAVIEDQQEFNEFKLRFGDSLPNDAWFGLNDLAEEKDYEWVENTPIDNDPPFYPTPGMLGDPPLGAPVEYVNGVSFDNWSLGQPNNFDGADGAIITKDLSWRMQPVNVKTAYILEVQRTDPNNPDTDGDGLWDGAEFERGTDPNDPSTFDRVETISVVIKGVTEVFEDFEFFDGYEGGQDTDGDGLPDIVETNTGTYINLYDTGTDPENPDTDGDGLLDGVENDSGTFVRNTNTGSDPLNRDTDGDLIIDGDEIKIGTDPNEEDSDGDGISDGDELRIVDNAIDNTNANYVISTQGLTRVVTDGIYELDL